MRNAQLIAGAAALCLLAACGGGGGGGGASEPEPEPPPPPPDWFSPTCDTVTGPPIASYSPDAGITIVPNTEPIEPNRANETVHLAAAHDYGGLLFAKHVETRVVYFSTDAGCHWEFAAMQPPGETISALVATDRLGYALYGGPNGSNVIRMDAEGNAEDLELPWFTIDLATTPDDPQALYALFDPGDIFRSDDQGVSWTGQGSRVPSPRLLRQLVINSNDQMHMVVTGHNGELSVTFDGGNNWITSTGIVRDSEAGGTQMAVFSSDEMADEVWVKGTRNFRETNTPTERFIARSVDGGLTFEDIVHDGGEIRFAGGVQLATRPDIAGEVLFTGIDCPFHPPRLFHYRASDDTVTIITYEPGETRGLRSILFHPTDPDILYVGHQATGGCPQ